MDSNLAHHKVSAEKLIDTIHAYCAEKSETTISFYREKPLKHYRGIALKDNFVSKLMVEYEPLLNDPGCYWHEFCLLFLRLARLATKDLVSQRKFSDVLKCFFKDFLKLDDDQGLCNIVLKNKNSRRSKILFAYNIEIIYYKYFLKLRKLNDKV